MIDEAKVAAVREAIRDLADEYSANGAPDVGRQLREISKLTPAELIRLRELMRAGRVPR